MGKMEEVLKVLPKEFRESLRRLEGSFEKLQEIRLRIGRPVLVYLDGQEYFLGPEGLWNEERQQEPELFFGTRKERGSCSREKAWVITREHMNACLEYMSAYSAYAFMEEVRQGFLTLPGGHRVGLCGKTVMEGEQVKTICSLSSLNIRIAHEKQGCCLPWLSYVYEKGQPLSLLLLSPPGCGKTTLLRDFICRFSDGNRYGRGLSVTVLDERSEIAASYLGQPQNYIGKRTDVLDCCKKAAGMELAIRSMAPKILAMDELGGEADLAALERAVGCGCRLLATVHGENLEDIRKRPVLKRIFTEKWFSRYLILRSGRVGEVEGIYDENLRCLTDSGRVYGYGSQSDGGLEAAVSGA